MDDVSNNHWSVLKESVKMSDSNISLLCFIQLFFQGMYLCYDHGEHLVRFSFHFNYLTSSYRQHYVYYICVLKELFDLSNT